MCVLLRILLKYLESFVLVKVFVNDRSLNMSGQRISYKIFLLYSILDGDAFTYFKFHTVAYNPTWPYPTHILNQQGSPKLYKT